jgi:hypothetical protein
VHTNLALLTLTTFEPLLNARFSVKVANNALELELIELESLGPARPDQREPFSLIFRGPRERWFEQGTYPLEHPELGAPEIFLVPIGPDAIGMQYQAIFT